MFSSATAGGGESRPLSIVPSVSAASESAHVAILLASRNGARFLTEQLASFQKQTHKDWSLHLSDDGSTDSTVEIFMNFASRVSNGTSLRHGPRAGCHRNFFSLVRDDTIDADYFALSDQDDVWYPDKLQRAVSVLKQAGDEPALYCSRTELIDQHGCSIGFSTENKRPPSFKNALVENIAGGNTMVFNRAARALLKKVADDDVVIHDWTIYVVLSAVGGRIYYDRSPSVMYRQHDANLIGAYSSFSARLRRIQSGQWQKWTSIHLNCLRSLLDDIPPENRRVLESFIRMRKASWFYQRCWHLLKSGVYRQTSIGQTGLLLGAVSQKI
ncbi:glycosyltransferase family 2 protein [Bradyrhizobium sp. SZCCHNRI3037]|uniref:glycosyltransferase family 2 protein n=1 Tax=Bradyrhizobium sp. SZCCHNRI3037 TaxID=3057290 RepID=UPI0029170C7F|nr:glycosyltransferase family 2 protein [Bradyrhizobium sp. SZCCHNRI3037]